jgi:hypothetical protein
MLPISFLIQFGRFYSSLFQEFLFKNGHYFDEKKRKIVDKKYREFAHGEYLEKKKREYDELIAKGRSGIIGGKTMGDSKNVRPQQQQQPQQPILNQRSKTHSLPIIEPSNNAEKLNKVEQIPKNDDATKIEKFSSEIIQKIKQFELFSQQDDKINFEKNSIEQISAYIPILIDNYLLQNPILLTQSYPRTPFDSKKYTLTQEWLQKCPSPYSDLQPFLTFLNSTKKIKKNCQIILNVYEKVFFEKTGRRIHFCEDIGPISIHWYRYREYRVQLEYLLKVYEEYKEKVDKKN